MRKKFSKTWIRSKQARKQRKYRHNAPLHIRQKLIHIHLSKELRKKYGKRTISPRQGDRVKVLRGSYKGKEGVIDKIDLKKLRVYVRGVERIKKDGSKVMVGLEPSNLMLSEIKIEDKKRKEKLENKAEKVEKK